MPDEMKPDANCVTTPDGGCVGGPCMHDVLPFTKSIADKATDDFQSWLLCEQIVLENTTPGAERIETSIAIAKAVVVIAVRRLRACKMTLTEILALVRATYERHGT